jgi:hypothetical protein
VDYRLREPTARDRVSTSTTTRVQRRSFSSVFRSHHPPVHLAPSWSRCRTRCPPCHSGCALVLPTRIVNDALTHSSRCTSTRPLAGSYADKFLSAVDFDSSSRGMMRPCPRPPAPAHASTTLVRGPRAPQPRPYQQTSHPSPHTYLRAPQQTAMCTPCPRPSTGDTVTQPRLCPRVLALASASGAGTRRRPARVAQPHHRPRSMP